MPRSPISVQLYSVRDRLADDLEGTLERLAALGFTNVEPYGAFVVDSDDYVAALDGCELPYLKETVVLEGVVATDAGQTGGGDAFAPRY